jgi:hypothetical protein
VLILGRFGFAKRVLETIADELKQHGYIPVIFDFPKPTQRDLVETLILLAGMSAFVIVDMTNPRSAPMELQAIAANYGVPIVPIIRRGQEEFGMFPGLRKFQWVLPTVEYHSIRQLRTRLTADVIEPAFRKARSLAAWKARVPSMHAAPRAKRG